MVVDDEGEAVVNFPDGYRWHRDFPVNSMANDRGSTAALGGSQQPTMLGQCSQRAGGAGRPHGFHEVGPDLPR